MLDVEAGLADIVNSFDNDDAATNVDELATTVSNPGYSNQYYN